MLFLCSGTLGADGGREREQFYSLSWTAQQGGEAMGFKKFRLVGLAMVPLVGLLSLTGTSGVLAAPLENTLESTGTAEDHLAAARRYQNEAQESAAEAAKFETAVSKIGRYEDTKGFRRAALTAAAQEKRYEAKEAQELYAAHLRQANALHGKLQPQ
jgi:uncharacterized iron-regulated membrane protein